MDLQDYAQRLENLSEDGFSELALEVFRYQYTNNPVYRRFSELLKRTPPVVDDPEQIPFLPISAYKHHKIISGNCNPELIFKSSGTGGPRSVHYVCDPNLYRWSFLKGFESIYGPPSAWCILALLPGYLENRESSLVYMAAELIRMGLPGSGFYLNQHDQMLGTLYQARKEGKPVMLLGVAFALYDLAINEKPDLHGVVVMETGGMKGRKREITREELHRVLCHGLNIHEVHSEYGMTELLSQAYAPRDGIFTPPPWMRVLIRDISDPLSPAARGHGRINIIDLANVHSCSFIATDDMGSYDNPGSFRVSGRAEAAELRGCNLLTVPPRDW